LDAVQHVLAQTAELIRKGQAPNWSQLEKWLVEAVMAQGLRPNQKRKPLIFNVKARLRRAAPLPA
jgi:hypothetical protein